MEWTKSKVVKKMEEIRDKGFIPVPDDIYLDQDKKEIILRISDGNKEDSE